MYFSRVLAIYFRQLFLLRHNPTRFANIFLWIVLDVVLWGFITKYLNDVGNSGFSFVTTLLGAVILWDFLIRVQQGVMLAFFEDVWSQNFLNLFASPLTLKEYVAGLILTSITTSAAGFVFMLLLAALFFGYSVFSLGLPLLFFVLIIFIFGLAVGVFAVAVVLRFGPSAEWFAWPIPFMLSPFVGIYYPISILPPVMQIIGRFLPPTYAFEGMRQVLFAGTTSISDLTIGIGLSLAFLLASYAFLVAIYRGALKSGRLAKFSAEGN